MSDIHDDSKWLEGNRQGHRLKKPVLLALGLVSILCYARSFSGELFFDNEPMILLDKRIQSMDGVGDILTTQYWSGIAQTTLFRPVTTLTYLFNYTILDSGKDPFTYHVVNTLLHGLVAIVLVLALMRIGVSPLASYGAAFLFAAHPLATESVANIVGRADILSALFALLALVFHVRVRDKANPGWLRVIPALFFALAMGSKESGIVFIAFAIAFDLGPGRSSPFFRDKKRLLMDYAGLVASLVVMQVWRFIVIRDIAPREFDVGDNALVLGSLVEREGTVLKVFVLYLGRLLWPSHLSADHSYPQIEVIQSLFNPLTIMGLAVVVAWTMAAIMSWRKSKTAFFLLLFFPIAFAPVSNAIMLIGTIMAERLLYLPMMGPLALIAMLVVSGSKRWFREKAVLIASIIFAVLTVSLGARTVVRNGDWLTELRFWRATHEASPRSLRAINGYAKATQKEDPSNISGAVEIQRRCLDVGVESARSLARLGEYLSLAAIEGVRQGNASADAYLIEAKTYLTRAKELDLRSRRDWASRNEWYKGHPDAAPMNELLVFESLGIWFDAHRAWTSSQGESWDDKTWEDYEQTVRQWIVARPGASDSAIRWLRIGIQWNRPEIAIKATPMAFHSSRGAAEVRVLVRAAFESAGVSFDRYLESTPPGGLPYPHNDRADQAKKLRTWLDAGWRSYVRLYVSQGYLEIAQKIARMAQTQGVPAEVFEGVSDTVLSPLEDDFWR